MKRFLTIFLVYSFVTSSFAARVTNIKTSINSNTSEAVTISTAWTGTDGDLVLSASVPASVKIGDTITDSGGNTYLITGISGSNLTSQDFDTTTDPATGSATIQEAYNLIQAWENGLDVTALYASGDAAIGEMYDNGAFNETITVNGGATSAIASVTLTVPVSERHDGTAGTGARIVASTARQLNIEVPDGDNYFFEWFEIDQGGFNGPCILNNSSSFQDVATLRNLIVHDQDGGDAFNGLVFASTRDIRIMNSIFYDNSRNSTSAVRGLFVDADRLEGGIYNCTVWNIANPGSGTAFGIFVSTDDVDHDNKNNVVMNTTAGGTDLDFNFAGTNPDALNNCSEDASADDAGGSGHQISKTAANQFVSTTGGSEDFHIQDKDADIFETGVDLVATPTNINFDIDNFDRNAGATTWSIGAHDGNNLRGAAVRRRPIILF